jgi:trk system potassium uptake protein TrkA
MNLAVLGLGTFGKNLTISLSEAGHQISVLDMDAKAVASVQNLCELALVADCTDRAALEQMHPYALQCAIVALGNDMGASVLCTLLLKEMGAPRVVAKAVTAEHKTILKRVGADQVVFPEQEAAARLAMSLTYSNLLDYLPIGPDYSIMELAPPAAMVGKSIGELDLRRKYGINVLAVRELVPERLLPMVEPDFIIKDSDVLVVLGNRDNLERLRKLG